MVPISLSAQTLYAQLLDMPRGALRLAGSLYEKEISGARYLYRKETIGINRRDRYLGKVGLPETEKCRRDTELGNLVASQRREMVKMLRTQVPSHLPALARMLIVLQHYGVLESSKTVLVGTNAYICYSALVGFKLDHAVMSTDDADIATLDIRSSDDSEQLNLLAILQNVDKSFRALPELSHKSFPSRFRSDSGLRLDLITQDYPSKKTGTVEIRKLAAGAQPLHHVAWLIGSPASAAVLNDVGVLVHVPQPARFAVHKLLLAQKRSSVDRLKRQKDLMQARSLIDALRISDPNALSDAYSDACSQGKKGWAEHIRKSLDELGMVL